jgi:hypothetical protein
MHFIKTTACIITRDRIDVVDMIADDPRIGRSPASSTAAASSSTKLGDQQPNSH